ncbi:hypothetical protein [Rhizobium leguminosarum]|uniref:hypothetical protein n=1 Tax=Rhizobium leguminosarum TaxID=384 RepID=UPI000B92CD5F|nr:hypothetical protein [Rhizobium leguminosarum]ASS55887.1 hypothetical protein CHR56_15670 [Rhizobium leguminosarum bv. viciae]
MTNFHVGQKVVCIWEDTGEPGPEPKCGVVYTVSAVFMAADLPHIDLVELPCPDTDEWFGGYKAEAFRPVAERKTDISIFTDMLTKQRTGVQA